MNKIAIVGLGHTGSVYTACLSELGFEVIGIDSRQKVIANLNKNIPPFNEIGVASLLEKNSKKITFSTDHTKVSEASIVWVTVDTPLDGKAQGNTHVVFKTIERIAPHISKDSLLIVTSQIPVGTSKEIITNLKEVNTNNISYAYIPENLRIGQAIDSFLNPSQIVIGIDDDTKRQELTHLFEKIHTHILFVHVASAEMIKHATNAYLATSMSFIYDIADVCERVGADVTEVSKGLKADARIGEKAYVDASVGFSGGHLERDLQYLKKLAHKHGLSLPVIDSVQKKNIGRPKKVLETILPLLGDIQEKTITFLGMTYKQGATTLEHSLPLKVAKQMASLGATIHVYDPLIHKELTESKETKDFSVFSDPYKAVVNAHAVICITPWPEIKELDFRKMAESMQTPKILFDARNFFLSDEMRLTQAGMMYVGIGRKIGTKVTV